ncbi:MAG: COX15/CtaA family protein [Pseudomonadota bacterium]
MTAWFYRLALVATILALVVVVLGAYVRLTHAGLGCPDWPGCYGQLGAPDSSEEIAAAESEFAGAEIDSGKAWREMIHRYFAGTLGLLILALAVIAWRNRYALGQQVVLPILLVVLVVFQAALGMWTVTLLLQPVIVTLHLLMGMLTLALLWWMTLRAGHSGPTYTARPATMSLRGLALGGALVVYLQIALGGWVSTNYAALHCPDFPTCQQQWWPSTDFAGAFRVLGEPGVNYEGGQLSLDQGVTVHLVHRLGAVVTLFYLAMLGFLTWTRGADATRRTGTAMLALLAAQIALGIANVILVLPLSVAVAHNAGAALLLLSLVTLNLVVRSHQVSIYHSGG